MDEGSDEGTLDLEELKGKQTQTQDRKQNRVALPAPSQPKLKNGGFTEDAASNDAIFPKGDKVRWIERRVKATLFERGEVVHSMMICKKVDVRICLAIRVPCLANGAMGKTLEQRKMPLAKQKNLPHSSFPLPFTYALPL